jgi:hypothetical protein
MQYGQPVAEAGPEFINIANALNIAPETLLARVLRW